MFRRGTKNIERQFGEEETWENRMIKASRGQVPSAQTTDQYLLGQALCLITPDLLGLHAHSCYWLELGHWAKRFSGPQSKIKKETIQSGRAKYFPIKLCFYPQIAEAEKCARAEKRQRLLRKNTMALGENAHTAQLPFFSSAAHNQDLKCPPESSRKPCQ